MKRFLCHFEATPKSVGAFVLAGIGMLVAFRYLDTGKAEAIGVFVTAGLALLKPARKEEE